MTTPNLGPSPEWGKQQGLITDPQWEQEDNILRDIMMKALALAKDNILSTEEWGLSDDGLDYLSAAMDNANKLVTWYQDHDWTAFQAWLNESSNEWLACDGEIRFDLAKDPRFPQIAQNLKAWEEQ